MSRAAGDWSRRELLAAWVTLAGFWLLATAKFYHSYYFRFPDGHVWGVADDVYISATFARTWASGEGLRWYPGAPLVEGFTSPLWVAVIAALHALPGFGERTLGLCLLCFGAACLVAVAGLVVLGLAFVTDRNRARSWPAFLLGLAVAALSGISLCHWTASGFETVLVAATSLGLLVECLRPKGRPRAALVAACVCVAGLTRLDALLYCAGPLAVGVWGMRGRRDRLVALGIPAAVMASLFLLRKSYFDEWLPNTYYLKATGWDANVRVIQGWMQNGSALAVTVSVYLPMALLSLTHLTREKRHLLAGSVVPMLVFILGVTYSTYIGGDIAFEVFGYDRFGSVGAVFLPLVMACLLADGGGVARTGAVVGAVAAVVPVACQPGFDLHLHLRPARVARPLDWQAPLRPFDVVGSWIHTGIVINRFTRPGAMVALCAAGAPAYFSRRPAMDLLGKIDKVVARLAVAPVPPPDARCWRGLPGAGHNKEDTRGSFARVTPDLSQVAPPDALMPRYVKITIEGVPFWARVASNRIEWRNVTIVPPRRLPALFDISAR